MTNIIGIPVPDRANEAPLLQELLTKYGCYIQTRIGLHPLGTYQCRNDGVILIEVIDKFNEIYDELRKHWDIQCMKF